MESVKGNPDGQKNIQVRRLVNDTDLRDQPLKILEQEISVFEKPEHAQIHADAGDQPGASRMAPLSLRNPSAEPKIHCRRGKEQRSERRVPRAIKNVARHDEQVLPQVPRPDGPVRGHDHREKNNEGE